jgi:SAM-dependent methyltransferase
MERLAFGKDINYDALEASIHLNRYALARPFCEGKIVLDVACGEGYGSYLLKMWGAKQIEAVDIDSEAIEKASIMFSNENINYMCQNAEKLPYADNSFDLIVSLETIEHLDNPDKFLLELRRVIKPDGTIILSCPNDPYYYDRANTSNPFHKQKYNFFEFKEFVEQYLGSHVQYFLGFAINGFLNMPITRGTEPSSNPAKTTSNGIFEYIDCSSALCLPQDRYLNHWNCNYYVGIWGKFTKAYDISTVLFPRETFVDYKDKDYDLLNHLRKFNKTVKTEKNRQTEIERLKLLIDLTTRERDAALNSVAKNWECYQSALKQRDDEITRLTENEKVQKIEIDRLKLLNELTKRERDASQAAVRQNWESYQNTLCELNVIKASRGYRLLNLYYRIKRKIRKILGIND